jgi:hypothetical protein
LSFSLYLSFYLSLFFSFFSYFITPPFPCCYYSWFLIQNLHSNFSCSQGFVAVQNKCYINVNLVLFMWVPKCAGSPSFFLSRAWPSRIRFALLLITLVVPPTICYRFQPASLASFLSISFQFVSTS